jgi:hypothetical protein
MDKLNKRAIELTMEIDNWGKYNSQSNPGAMMELRFMKKELIKILKQIENSKKK